MPFLRDPIDYDQCDPARNMPNLSECLEGTNAQPPPRHILPATRTKSRKRNPNTSDCSQDPPLELRENIAVLLPTRDYSSLRCASPVMTPISHNNMFWKSQFWLDGDRGFLSCLTMDSASTRIDWRLVYRASCNLEFTSDIGVRLWEVSRWT
ncbi:hypothetical protein BJX64DRAFT_171007 [Aspergillus heterothallicus]